ncbi:MAG: hypothetical protein Q8O99_03155 [bacterium]|nr:hypothetical protein [bacterium]
MLDQIKETVFKLYNAEEKKGVFLSGFDDNKRLVVSQGIVTTQQPLRETLSKLYISTIEPLLEQIAYISVDMVTDIVSFPQANEVLKLDPKEYGFVVEDLEDNKTGVILPNTAGVTDAKQVLYDLKKKYSIHGKVAVSGFKTERILISK